LKGYEVLLDLDKEVKGAANSAKINALSSTFYTMIPHSFGRSLPPPINTAEKVQQKMDMLNVLGDIEIAQNLEKNQKPAAVSKPGEVLPNPMDSKFETLKCNTEPLDPSAPEFQIIKKFFDATKPQGGRMSIKHVFTINREGEGDRFKAHDKITNRRLLWHGTNVAVVAAIMSSGLRIMPHSGGRVGKGIYLASENSKSAGYVRTQNNIGIMLLAEAALGNEHHITMDDWQITAPPSGKDCIIAQGRTEPDPKMDTTLTLDGKSVTVPQGKALQRDTYKTSNFHQSEYLVYKESQARLRYLLMINWS